MGGVEAGEKVGEGVGMAWAFFAKRTDTRGPSPLERGQWALSSLHSELQMPDLKSRIGALRSEICNLSSRRGSCPRPAGLAPRLRDGYLLLNSVIGVGWVELLRNPSLEARQENY